MHDDIYRFGDYHDGVYDRETGYDSRAYPSEFLSSDGKYYSDGMSPDLPDVGTGIESYLEKLAAETSAKTVSVQSYGAKGDGKSDDTMVCMLIRIYNIQKFHEVLVYFDTNAPKCYACMSCLYC